MVTEKTRATTVRTQRLFLRAASMGDAPAFNKMTQDAEVLRYINPHKANPEPETPSGTEARLRARLAENLVMHVALLLPPHLQGPAASPDGPVLASLHSDPSHAAILAESEPVGSLGVRDDFGIGYTFGRDHWGRGLATEATEGLLALVWGLQAEWEEARRGGGQPGEPPFGQMPRETREGEMRGREYVQASANPGNRASHRVLEKCGGVRAEDVKYEDWDQTAEERERDGVGWFTLWAWRLYRPL